jgi:hypothetical protein
LKLHLGPVLWGPVLKNGHFFCLFLQFPHTIGQKVDKSGIEIIQFDANWLWWWSILVKQKSE